MAGAKTHTHDYHLVPTSPWPIIGAFSALVMAVGAVGWMHKAGFGSWVFFLGFAGVLLTFTSWWMDVVHEANTGDHTPVVQLHHRYGMILFIASEVMFFVAWFWAYFSSSLYPSTAAAIGGSWPPKGIEVLDPFAFPLLNTLILLLSGTTVTWAHHALIHGDRDDLVRAVQSERLATRLQAAGRPYYYLRLPWANHGCDVNLSGPCGQITTYAVERFLAAVVH